MSHLLTQGDSGNGHGHPMLHPYPTLIQPFKPDPKPQSQVQPAKQLSGFGVVVKNGVVPMDVVIGPPVVVVVVEQSHSQHCGGFDSPSVQLVIAISPAFSPQKSGNKHPHSGGSVVVVVVVVVVGWQGKNCIAPSSPAITGGSGQFGHSVEQSV
jgi:hypothetical protein